MIGWMGFWWNGNLTEPTIVWLFESSQKFYPKHAAILDKKYSIYLESVSYNILNPLIVTVVRKPDYLLKKFFAQIDKFVS